MQSGQLKEQKDLLDYLKEMAHTDVETSSGKLY